VADKKVYEQLASMYETIGAPNTPSLMKIMRLQFTPLEAKLAVQIGFTGGKLDELTERTGVEKSKLKKILYTMAEKGTMWIDPGVDDPTYKTIGLAAPGIIETGLWCGVKFPYTVQLGQALHEFLYEWSRDTLCKIGIPFAPVWGAITALPEDALPTENLAEVIKDQGHWSTSPCPCRLAHRLVDPGNHCDHILGTCIHTGDVSRWTVEHGMATELTYEEVVELLKKCNEDGLVQSLNINNCICNCCNDCCAIFHSYKQGAPTFLPSPFMSQIDEALCDGCKACAEACPVDAIEVDGVAFVDADTCIGCSVCVPTCKPLAIKMVRRPKVEEKAATA
jgi:Pyruvate/2-oxoacid:ferredoxin oxidoreductase delta subunit